MCPYHGWQYDRTGMVSFIPALGPNGNIPSQARVHRYNVREQYGAVWVALETPVADLPPWPDGDWNSPDWRVLLVGSWRWQTSAGRMVENVIDFAHFNFVHEGFTELADGPFIKPYDVKITDDGMTYAYDDSVLVRDYTLHLPFTLHDRKVVMATYRRGHLDRAERLQGRIQARRRHDRLVHRLAHRSGGDVHPRVPVPQSFLRCTRRVLRRRLCRWSWSRTAVVVEAQDPPELPLDPREELHLKVSDSASILYRRLMRELRPAVPV